jgi:quercetin dioxygenase-like cupin family protein
MTPPKPVRRIVTGHTGETAIVLSDGPGGYVRELPTGARSTLMWSTDQMPTDISVGTDVEDLGARKLGTQPPPNGSRFNVNDIPPGHPGIMHRTESLDYAIILAGEIDMELDDGQRVSLNAGDVVVQRGTNHSWINRGTGWARIAFVLLDAQPLGIGHPVPPGSMPTDTRGH